MSKLTKPTRTQWFSLETLGALINRHLVDDSTSRAIHKIMRADLICIDLCRAGDKRVTSQAFDARLPAAR